MNTEKAGKRPAASTFRTSENHFCEKMLRAIFGAFAAGIGSEYSLEEK